MKYIKNITNPNNKLGAYIECDGIFKLHFNHIPDKSKINVGENIVLYQKIDKDRVFSHLVVIIDNNVYEDLSRRKYAHYIFVKIISKGYHKVLETIIWKDIEHGGYTGGKLVNIENLKQVQEDSSLKDLLREEIWKLFFPNPQANF